MVDSALADDDSSLQLNQRRAVILRWWLLAAMAIAVSSAPAVLGIALPQLPMLAVLVPLIVVVASLEP